MNPSKTEDDLFPHHLDPPIIDHRSDLQPSILGHHHPEPFALPPMSEIVLFRDEDDDSLSHSSSDADDAAGNHHNRDLGSTVLAPANDGVRLEVDIPRVQQPGYINPEPHISTQFYTFNAESHALMIRCLLEGRLATPDEIRAVTPVQVLASWRTVWKDRNEDTAFLTAWKRIQDKLNVHVDPHGSSGKILRIKYSYLMAEAGLFRCIGSSYWKFCVSFLSDMGWIP